jgi:hypothetical protein
LIRCGLEKTRLQAETNQRPPGWSTFVKRRSMNARRSCGLQQENLSLTARRGLGRGLGWVSTCRGVRMRRSRALKYGTGRQIGQRDWEVFPEDSAKALTLLMALMVTWRRSELLLLNGSRPAVGSPGPRVMPAPHRAAFCVSEHERVSAFHEFARQDKVGLMDFRISYVFYRPLRPAQSRTECFLSGLVPSRTISISNPRHHTAALVAVRKAF